MKRPSAAGLFFLIMVIFAAPFLGAQDHMGTIQGTVTDAGGRPLVGAAVYLASPALLGMRIVLTGKNGTFDFAALGSGVYSLTAEMPGFITLIRDNVRLRSGMSIVLPVKLNASEMEEEVRVKDPLPALEKASVRTVFIQEQAFLRNLPLARNLGDILNLVPGVVAPGYLPSPDAAIHGGAVRNNIYTMDGVNLTDMSTGIPTTALAVDLMEEIETVSAGQTASRLPAGGAYVNVVTKSGGNSFAGEWGLHLINEGWNRNLWTTSEIKNLGVAPPAGDRTLFEPTLSLGGPLWEDRAWYFMSGRYAKKSSDNNFVGPYRDILGHYHENYDWTRKDLSGFFKLTLRPIDQAKFTAWADLAKVNQPVYEDPSPRLPFLSTHILENETSTVLHGALEYSLNPAVQAYVRGAYISRNIPTGLQTEAQTLSWSDDAGDLYGPLSGADYNSVVKRRRLQADASLRIFADRLLGTTHTISVGADFDNSSSDVDWWRQNNLLQYLDSRNPNGYYYPDRGLLGFWLCGAQQTSTLLKGRTQALGAYVTDTFAVARRLTFNLGLRFDLTWAWFPASSKQESGNPLSLFIGDAFVNPAFKASYPDSFPAGYNPWDAITIKEMKNFLSYYALSPRAGLIFDVLGNGKTLLKASFARYADALSHRTVLPLHPLYPRDLAVNWMDVNGDGRPDMEDEFSLAKLDYRFLSGADIEKRVAGKIKAPYTQEISLGLEQDLFKDFTLGLRFLSRQQKNILEDVLYAPDTGDYWYSSDQAAAGKYWIPFTTTVPGTAAYAGETVTLYAKSLQAPPIFLQFRNVPELERKYKALVFTFEKRMSRGWQAAGSLVWSKTEGNIGGFADASTSWTAAANGPNDFINRTGRLDTDRPLQINLQGAVALPLQTMLSASFSYLSGSPWQRWAYILPPAAWCSTNKAERVYYAVNLEAPGSRREKSWSSFDLRLEKGRRVGAAGRLGLYVDIVNLLGSTASIVGLNDIDRWEPAAEGAGQTGIKYLRPDYRITSAVYGKRTIRFGFRLDF